MITAISWVPRGAAKTVPIEAEPPTQEEIEEAKKSIALGRAGGDADDAEGDEDDGDMELDDEDEVDEVAQARAAAKALGKSSSAAVGDISDGLAELNMDAYDEEEDELEVFSTGLGDLYYKDNEDDPYIIKKNDDDDEDDDDDSEIEDMTIKPTDIVLVCAHNEDEFNSLQVSIVEELEDGDPNMFVHHEVPLSDFPLCTAWMDFNRENGDEKGNFIAVGTMNPIIEIWNLDIVDEVEPHAVLGGLSKKQIKGKKPRYKKRTSHKNSVLGLAWNAVVRNVLASSSADKTIRLWDLSTGQCAVTLQHHDGKVQSVAWRSPEVLLSGSFDKSVIMSDMRDNGQTYHKWAVEADVESLVCDPHNEHSFLVSLDNGMVQAFDTRTASSNSNSGQPTFTLHAHNKAASAISFCPSKPNFIATGGTDKMVKLWDISNNQPSCVASLNAKLGAVFTVSFCNDSPFLLACGGSKGKLKVWNTLSEPAVACTNCCIYQSNCSQFSSFPPPLSILPTTTTSKDHKKSVVLCLEDLRRQQASMATTRDEAQQQPLHMLFLPYFALGHLIPVTDMAGLFAARGARCTILTTPVNADIIRPAVDRANAANLHGAIVISILPFPDVGLPPGMENLKSVTPSHGAEYHVKFVQATQLLREPFDRFLATTRPRVDAVVSDSFFPWSTDSAAAHGVPRLVFLGSSVFARSCSETMLRNSPLETANCPDDPDALVLLPGLPHRVELRRSQMLDPGTRPLEWAFYQSSNAADQRCFGEVFNSFHELEPDYVEHFRTTLGRRAWLVGPVALATEDMTPTKAYSPDVAGGCLQWLNTKPAGSVVYVSFGTLTSFSLAEHREIARGLDLSGKNFVWVLSGSDDDRQEWMPEGFAELTGNNDRGFLIRGWAPQTLILSQQALGGFVTHCGWNSVLEAVSAGVPMVTWPRYADQFYNEKLVVEVLKVGVSVGAKDYASCMETHEVISGEVIAGSITRLMGESLESDSIRIRVKARNAVEKGGGSYNDVGRLMDELMAGRSAVNGF